MRHSISINLTHCHFSLALIILIIDVLHACTVNSKTLIYKKQSKFIMWNLGHVTIMLQPSQRIIWFSYQLNYCLSPAGHCFTERSSEQVRRHPPKTRALNFTCISMVYRRICTYDSFVKHCPVRQKKGVSITFQLVHRIAVLHDTIPRLWQWFCYTPHARPWHLMLPVGIFHEVIRAI